MKGIQTTIDHSDNLDLKDSDFERDYNIVTKRFFFPRDIDTSCGILIDLASKNLDRLLKSTEAHLRVPNIVFVNRSDRLLCRFGGKPPRARFHVLVRNQRRCLLARTHEVPCVYLISSRPATYAHVNCARRTCILLDIFRSADFVIRGA